MSDLPPALFGERIKLTRFSLGMQEYLTDEVLARFRGERELQATYEDTVRRMCFRMIQHVYGKQLELIHEQWPADWWQAVKERWAPRWFLRRWPVRYRELRVDVKALYPTLAPIDGHEPRIVAEVYPEPSWKRVR